MRCHYVVLGLSRDSPVPDIRRAYHRLCLQYHPDKNTGPTDTTAQFQEVAAAYEILGDPKAKAEYDKGLRRQEKGKRHEMEVKLRKGAWEMDARRKKAQQDNYMRTWHKRNQDIEDDSESEINVEKTYFGEAFWAEFERSHKRYYPGPSSATRSNAEDPSESFMSSANTAENEYRTTPPSFAYASTSADSGELFTTSAIPTDNKSRPGPQSFAYDCVSAEFGESSKSNSRPLDNQSRPDPSRSAFPIDFDYSGSSLPHLSTESNGGKTSSRSGPRKSNAEFPQSDIFSDEHDDISRNDLEGSPRSASQPAAPKGMSHIWQRSEIRNTNTPAPAMETVSEDETEKRNNGQANQPDKSTGTQSQNDGEDDTNDARGTEKKGNITESIPVEPELKAGKIGRKRRKTRPPSWRFEPAPEFIPSSFAAKDRIPQGSTPNVPRHPQRPQQPHGLDFSFMFHSAESTKSKELPKTPKKPQPVDRPRSAFQKARAMSYQKLDEICSKLMTKGAKIKKEAKLAAEREAQRKKLEDETLKRQLSQRDNRRKVHNASGGCEYNEAQMSSLPFELAEWRVMIRQEYDTQRVSFERRRMKIENQLYEQHRILEQNNFAVKSLAGDYRIREAKLRGMYMAGIFMNSTVFNAMDNDSELVKIELDRAKSEKAAEQASSMIQILKQKMREEKQHYTKAVHMARVQNSINACRYLKENFDINSVDPSHPTQQELCLGIWESVGSISIEEALSGTADRKVLENLLLYQQWIETKESDKEIQFSKLDFFHKNEIKMSEEDKNPQEDMPKPNN